MSRRRAGQAASQPTSRPHFIAIDYGKTHRGNITDPFGNANRRVRMIDVNAN
jgi:hypothetical protein